jgi:hypothetical protein
MTHRGPSAAGGPVDEVRVTLALYCEDLDPDEVSRALGVQPTSAHRRGERKGPRSPAYRKGAWLLTEEGHEAEHVAPVIERLLRQLPEAPAVWNELRTQHDVQLRFGLHMSGWNKGLVIPRELVDRMASIGATLDFDIYAYGDGA